MDMFESWYRSMPVVTRSYCTLALMTTVACQFKVVSPLQLYYNYGLIFYRGQVWRLLTNFLYFGMLNIDFFFHMFFLVHYSTNLEQGSFRGRTADMVFMLLFGAACMLLVAPFSEVYFLGSSLSFMMVYVWGRRNPNARLNFLSLFDFNAPYLPWVLLGCSYIMAHNVVVDLIGIAIGHLYYYFEDVYPTQFSRRPLKTPVFMRALFDEDADIAPRGRNNGPVIVQPQAN